MRYKLTIEYKGTNYNGWQRQLKLPSVQGKIEDTIFKLFGEKVTIGGAGRTDKGVHALGQVAHLNLSYEILPKNLMHALNCNLPDDIKIASIEVVENTFFANKAKSKTYKYNLYISEFLKPLKDDFATLVKPPISIELMKQAGKLFLGVHDFEAFSCASRTVKTTVREISKLDIIEKNNDIEITIEGNGFLYNMVRIIVGTLVDIASEKKPISTINDMFLTKNRTLGGKTYPAKGLTLLEVKYNL